MESTEYGIVTRVHARKCRLVADSDGREVSCLLRGRLFHKRDDHAKPVAVGDRVLFRNTEKGAALEKILPRKNSLTRPAVGKWDELQTIAANIDRVLVVSSIKDPPLKTGLIDRFLVAAEIDEFDSLLCINKIDLVENEMETALLEETRELYAGLGYSVFLTNAIDGSGIGELAQVLDQGVSLIVGQSGVGKSTVINRINPDLELKTGEISAKQRKGKHTTTNVSLLKLCGRGFVVDTPGIREFGISRIQPSDIGHFFPEMAALLSDCQFPTCTHRHEPSCAVLDALKENRISPHRYKSYLKILKELEERKAY